MDEYLLIGCGAVIIFLVLILSLINISENTVSIVCEELNPNPGFYNKNYYFFNGFCVYQSKGGDIREIGYEKKVFYLICDKEKECRLGGEKKYE